MRRTAVLSVLVGLTLSACQEAPTAPTPADAHVDFALQSSVANTPLRLAGVPDGALVADLPTLNHGDRAVVPTACSSTPLVDQINADVNAWIAGEFDVIFALIVDFFADQVPFLEIRFLDTNDQVYGFDGDFTNQMNRTDRALRSFWDIDSDRIQLVAMKGTMLTDVDRVAATYEVLGNPADVSLEAAEIVRDLVLNSTFANDGNHPLFSFNAFAIQYSDGTGKIAMGDGIMEGYAALGFGDVAAPAIFGHEYAHHIQFQNGYFSDPIRLAMTSSAERTRYTELMADAYSAYFMTHKRGAAMNRHRVAEFLQAFFQIGDCSFTNPGHHGTPLQRMRAAQFGFDLADQAQKQGHIMTSDAFHDLFVAEYPNFIAP